VLKLFSDSAGVYGGFAAVFGNKWFAGEWPSMMNDLHITVKELFPIVLARILCDPVMGTGMAYDQVK
jgi:hypothetical protein